MCPIDATLMMHTRYLKLNTIYTNITLLFTLYTQNTSCKRRWSPGLRAAKMARRLIFSLPGQLGHEDDEKSDHVGVTRCSVVGVDK